MASIGTVGGFIAERAQRACGRPREHPRRRRRDERAARRDRPAGRDRRARALPRAAARHARARASSSSTRRPWHDAALECATAALAAGGPVDGVGITNQRASTIVWDRATGEPVGPGIGWQDLRTVGECLVLREQGVRVAPNESATKVAFLLDNADPDRTRDLCFGTVDTWIAWTLSDGRLARHRPVERRGHRARAHATAAAGTSHPRAAPHPTGGHAGDRRLDRGSSARRPRSRARRRSPGIAGDQQASLIGQGCVLPGMAKITFGTGGMLDVVLGADRPPFETRGDGRHVPDRRVAPRRPSHVGRRGGHAVGGTNVEWLRDDLGLIEHGRVVRRGRRGSARTPTASCTCPRCSASARRSWDYGARGTLLGLTGAPSAGTSCAPCSKASPTAAPTSSRRPRPTAASQLPSLRVDGGMAANPTFVQALADASQRPVEVSPVLEATTLGAGFLAGLALGTWSSDDEVMATWQPARIVQPDGTRRPRTLAGGLPARRRHGSPSCRQSTSDAATRGRSPDPMAAGPPQPAPADIALRRVGRVDRARHGRALQRGDAEAHRRPTSRPRRASATTTRRTRHAYASLAPGKATGQPNATLLLKSPRPQRRVQRTGRARATCSALENQMAETYAYALATLTTPDDLPTRDRRRCPSRAQHAAVLGTTLQLTPDGLFITGAFENAFVGDGSDVRRGFDMTVFPVG